MGAQIQVKGQLDTDKWQMRFFDYWDDQLCSLIHYSFPLDFDVNSSLSHEINNHSSAIQHTKDVKAYLSEENEFIDIYGSVSRTSTKKYAISHFLTREKLGVKHRRVIVDLSFPHGSSVNTGVDPD